MTMELLRTGLAYHPRFLAHDTGLALVSAPVPVDGPFQVTPHPEGPYRVQAVHRTLEMTGLLERLTPVAFEIVDDDVLALVHTDGYIEHLKMACATGASEAGSYVPICTASEEIARLAVGATIATVDAVLDGTLSNAFALVRPPGHHAPADAAMGYCLYNNVAIAARHARQRGVERIAIVDWDVHHGNGTESIFLDDPSVLYISTHQDAWYPADTGQAEVVGKGAGMGFNVNIPLPPGSGDATYARAYERLVAPILREFRPDLVLVSAGQDPNAYDPMGRMAVSSDGFRTIARRVLDTATDVAGGRVAIVLEGGYGGYAPVCTWSIIEELAGWRSGVEDPYRSWYGATPPATLVAPEAEAALARAAGIQSRTWHGVSV
ncbi:MAG: class II histone deacetylase [Chloroflexi bacterium]|nr:class II histone deacetylase [Chloroflexota bacterium]